MAKEGEVDTAIGRLRIAKTEDQEKAALGDLWEAGVLQGRIDVDNKLDDTLKAIRKGNDQLELVISKLKIACAERDALLEEFTKASWAKAAAGLIAVGVHHPSRHMDPEFQKKHGARACKKCSDKFVPWELLPREAREKKMKDVFAAVMKARANQALNKGVSDVTTTTHAVAGAAKPVLAPELKLLPPEPEPEMKEDL